MVTNIEVEDVVVVSNATRPTDVEEDEEADESVAAKMGLVGMVESPWPIGIAGTEPTCPDATVSVGKAKDTASKPLEGTGGVMENDTDSEDSWEDIVEVVEVVMDDKETEDSL